MNTFEALRAYREFAETQPVFKYPESHTRIIISKANMIGDLVLDKLGLRPRIAESPLPDNVIDLAEHRKQRMEKRWENPV